MIQYNHELVYEKEKKKKELNYPLILAIPLSVFLTLATLRDFGKMAGISVGIAISIAWLIVILLKIMGGNNKC